MTTNIPTELLDDAARRIVAAMLVVQEKVRLGFMEEIPGKPGHFRQIQFQQLSLLVDAPPARPGSEDGAT